jgi:hypothetical protein
MSEECPRTRGLFFCLARQLVDARAPSDANFEGNERIG